VAQYVDSCQRTPARVELRRQAAYDTQPSGLPWDAHHGSPATRGYETVWHSKITDQIQQDTMVQTLW